MTTGGRCRSYDQRKRTVRFLLEYFFVLLNISDLENVEKKCAQFLFSVKSEMKPSTNIIPETTTVTFQLVGVVPQFHEDARLY